MKKWKIGVAIDKKNPFEWLDCLKEIGYDGYLAMWLEDRDALAKTVEYGAKHGLDLTSLHAPFKRIDKIWKEGDEGEDVARELMECLDDCVRFGAPVLVSHPFIGFKSHTPTPIGLERYRRVGEYASKVGVKIAIENVEGEEYLDYLLPNLRDIPGVGFCLDTGHELCYNRGRDMLADYGDQLCYLHLNSNLGVTDPNGEITFYDDAHMLPFDGIADMEGLAKRLKKCGFEGYLTMELCKGNRPGRHTNDVYEQMPLLDYLAEAYRRGVRLAELMEKN